MSKIQQENVNWHINKDGYLNPKTGERRWVKNADGSLDKTIPGWCKNCYEIILGKPHFDKDICVICMNNKFK